MEGRDLSEAAPSKASNEGSIDGWDKYSKFQLYLGIKYRGSKDVKLIRDEFLPDKTEEEIEAAIAHYWENANQNPECTERKLKVRKTKAKTLIPLAGWAKLLTDSLSFQELQTETASAVRLIADLENMPPSKLTEQIDFRQVYHHLADAMEGKSLPDDRLISSVLYSCILDTALVCKAFINVNKLRNITANASLAGSDVTFFTRPTKDAELSIIRELLSQKNYNPLNIPEEALVSMLETASNQQL